MSGKLYLVATPIGNLEDITIRAIRVLKEVDCIAAEDTRHTLKLLNHLEISKPLISYHRHNEEIKTDLLIQKLLNGENIALVSDAGTPVISDPGEQIVKDAIKEGIEVVPIPGACALINALIASGLNTKEFAFYGFLSLNKKIRKEKLEEIKNEKRTSILYEAPHKLENTLNDILKNVGDRNIVLAKELTKIHEKFYRAKVSEVLENIENFKGEFIILIEENKDKNNQNFFDEWTLEQHYNFYEQQGMNKNEIIKKIAKDRKVHKNEIYKIFLKK